MVMQHPFVIVCFRITRTFPNYSSKYFAIRIASVIENKMVAVKKYGKRLPVRGGARRVSSILQVALYTQEFHLIVWQGIFNGICKQAAKAYLMKRITPFCHPGWIGVKAEGKEHAINGRPRCIVGDSGDRWKRSLASTMVTLVTSSPFTIGGNDGRWRRMKAYAFRIHDSVLQVQPGKNYRFMLI